MKKYFIVISLFVFLGVLVFAQQEPDLTGIDFPIPELGNCASREECKAFCDPLENIEACLNFAETHDLMPEEDIEIGRKMIEMSEREGPGGCIYPAECKAYCDDISHLKECVIFAEKYGLIPSEKLEETKKVIAAIDKGITPPPCNTKAECDIYCSEPEHMEMCVAFAEAAGVLSPEELEEAKKVLSAIKSGAKHPNCRGKTQCDIYCCGPEHMEECVTFAEAAGLISPQDAIMMRKTGGESPGGCCGKEACDAYCDDPNHMKECIAFAKKYGLMPKKEIEKAEKMLEAGLFGGPGGCKGQEECDAYCNDLSHMEECMDFALKAGFMTQEEAENAKKMVEMGITSGPGGCQDKEGCEAYCDNPDNMEECMEFGEKMGMISPEEEMMMQGGPGGCMGKEECESYCKDPAHVEECIKFGVEHGFVSPEEAEEMIKEVYEHGPSIKEKGGMPPEGMPAPEEEFYGPGGCKTKEECERYCSQPEHFEECGVPQSGEMMKTPEEYMPSPEETIKKTVPTTPSSEEKPIIEEEAPRTFLDLLPKFLADIMVSFLELK